MRQLELLAPARDTQIGIAAIDCGADAVYIAGPQFGARQAAGNSIDDIKALCDYAHKFGARIFVALNTILYDSELESAYRQMLAVQEAGADALIIQDMAVLRMASEGIADLKTDFHIPLHASTQCAIRTPEQAAFLESLGFSRLILERELSLEQIRAIRAAVTCELEFFVHGALCVCYSGQCYLSEKIAGRSANRGACIQACRSRYDLVDSDGKVLVKDKALLSLKDYNLRERIEELADAGISSFKIEGRLKNASYVKNVVRDYSIILDNLVEKRPDDYERGSYGIVTGGFEPDTYKTFNRGYTELYIDGKRGRWASINAAKSMGEDIGHIVKLNGNKSEIGLKLASSAISLNNGDGFSFVAKDGSVSGFRGDICQGSTIRCKSTPTLFNGARIYRNINAAFEKELDRKTCTRELRVKVDLDFRLSDNQWEAVVTAASEDGRNISLKLDAGQDKAENYLRMSEMIRSQIGKSTAGYRFTEVTVTDSGQLPFMSASALNGIRRSLAAELDLMMCGKKDILLRKPGKVTKPLPQKDITYKTNISNHISEQVYLDAGADSIEKAYELSPVKSAELMRTKYCIRFELGMCPVHQGAKVPKPLFLLNNGQRFALHFDCKACEMTLTEA